MTPTNDLEPVEPETSDLARRFWVGLFLSLPVFILALREVLGARYFEASRFYGNYLIQAGLSGVVVFWAGWPMLRRAKNSLSAPGGDVFTLTALGVLAAWFFSVAGVAFTPMLGKHTIEPIPVFFDSAAFVTLLALRLQILEVKTKKSTAPIAMRAEGGSEPVLDWFVPTVIGAAVLTFALWLCLGSNPGLMQAPEKATACALSNALAVMFAASPGALAWAASRRRNFLFACTYNAIAIPLAAGVLYPTCGFHLNPMLAAVAMSLSSGFVLVNILRLRSRFLS